MTRFPRSVAIAAGVTAAFVTGAAAGIFAGAPDAIVCPRADLQEGSTVNVVFYVDARDSDGVTFYKALGQQVLLLKVGPDGVVDAGRSAACTGKTLQELRDNGQAFDFG